jgi:phosphatidylserine synthase
VLLFTLTVSLLTGIAFGVFPAVVAYRADLNESERFPRLEPSILLRILSTSISSGAE